MGEKLWRHKKRGTIYRILHQGSMNWDNSLYDRSPVVIYQDIHQGNVEVRPRAEFFDGRFELIDENCGTNDPAVIAKLLRAIAGGTNAQKHGQDIILNAAADLLDLYQTTRPEKLYQ